MEVDTVGARAGLKTAEAIREVVGAGAQRVLRIDAQTAGQRDRGEKQRADGSLHFAGRGR